MPRRISYLFSLILSPFFDSVNRGWQFEFPHFFQKLNHLQNKKAKTLH